MKNTTNQKQSMHTLQISLPDNAYTDLKRIALFKDTNADELAFSYIIESIKNDSRIAKRMEFEEQLSEDIEQSEDGEKDREELLNDSKLLY